MRPRERTPGRRVARALAALTVAALALGAVGCATVKPWERDVLARPDMAFEPNPREARLRQHIFFSKESSLPGGGTGGGGCGCN